MPRPLVSMLTPSFNQGRWLRDNLHSVAVQTYPSIEHIVMDGGSSDDSVEVLRSADPPVIWRSEPDNGQPHAINKAFGASSGEIIGWINSDDALFDPGVVEDVVTFFEKHPGVDVVYGHGAKVTADGRIVYVIHVQRITSKQLHTYCPLIQPAVFIRRSAIEERFLDESYQFAMDWELWLHLAESHRFARIDRVLAIDRLQPERKMKTWMPVLLENTERLMVSYGVQRPTNIDKLAARWHRRTRWGGWRHALMRPNRLAFGGTQDSRLKLALRQFSNPAHWPPEFL